MRYSSSRVSLGESMEKSVTCDRSSSGRNVECKSKRGRPRGHFHGFTPQDFHFTQSLPTPYESFRQDYLFLLQLPLEKEEAKNAQSRRPKPAVIQNRTMSHSLPFPWPSDYEDPAATPLLPGSRTVLGPLTQGL